jgi:hypothetical protein
MKQSLICLAILALFLSACNSTSNTLSSNHNPTQGESEKRCGDTICDGPENHQNCPEDCPATAVVVGQNSGEQKPDSSPTEQNQQNNQPKSENAAAQDSGYRYVSFSGTIQTSLNTDSMGDFTGIAFEYSGEYSIEIWFPMEGGQAVQQRNSFVLTEFHDLYFGDATCTPCEWTLDDSSFEATEFSLEASLILESIEEDGQLADELVYQLTEMPQAVISGVVGCPCPGSTPDNFTDPGGHAQLMAWFMQQLVNPIRLNVLETNQTEQFPVSPMGFIDIPQETLSYVIVPDLNTP